MKYWDDERTRKMFELLEQGYPASYVGRELGCSRNAIIGRAHRLGFKVGQINGHAFQQSAKVKEPTPLRPKVGLYDFRLGNRPVFKYKPVKEAVKITMPQAPKPVSSPISIDDACKIHALNDCRCHWPLWNNDGSGERLYCGVAVNKKPYCETHSQNAFVGTVYRGATRAPQSSFNMRSRPAKLP